MNSRRVFFIALTALLLITACAIPGLQTASTPPPAPTADTGQIGMMVAGTVDAVIAQTRQAVPSQAPASIVVITTTPTVTPLPTPSATPTIPVPVQSTLIRQEDGSLLFADTRAGYEIKLPADWLAVRIEEKEYLDAFSLEESANAHVQQSLLSVQNEDPKAFRLLALDTQTAHIQNEFVTDMRFTFDEKKNISLGSDADLQAIAQTIPTAAGAFRFEVTSVKVVTSASGMQFGVIEAVSAFANQSGVEVPLYQKQVYFNAKGGTQTIILTTLADLKVSLLPAFDAMIETVKIVAGG